jgi:hypothetical protein
MIIQGPNNVASAYGASYKSAVERQTSPASEVNYADKVNISDAGKTMAKAEAESPSQEFRRITIEDAKLDPAFAEKFTREYAYDDSLEKGGPLVDISGYPTIRYTYTGELVTDANLTEFKAEAGKARKDRIALYQSEKSHGTSDVEILEKLFRSTDTQSDSYLSKIGWERANSIA